MTRDTWSQSWSQSWWNSWSQSWSRTLRQRLTGVIPTIFEDGRGTSMLSSPLVDLVWCHRWNLPSRRSSPTLGLIGNMYPMMYAMAPIFGLNLRPLPQYLRPLPNTSTLPRASRCAIPMASAIKMTIDSSAHFFCNDKSSAFCRSIFGPRHGSVTVNKDYEINGFCHWS